MKKLRSAVWSYAVIPMFRLMLVGLVSLLLVMMVLPLVFIQILIDGICNLIGKPKPSFYTGWHGGNGS